ncbi:myo-inositol-1(or 4)-monophosphatase [Persephonella hydrogeniphila]|uniref:Inositol-1-monophosphatase n=1 Tax=Persephonella hydrogeniphila TaxID=198703 RepID=A0A285NJ30_9AQUI|nr:inositol monophosphatase family protein [Persephonella hydrogeniphila]SNZ09490.1 myo-inositol-1(or 4)-monophosphatase [Persephonella hydrogeniphila]
MDIERFIQTAKEAAVLGGYILKENFKTIKREDVEYKDKKDFVTFVDKLSEDRIRNFILSVHPEHSFLGEEEGVSGNKNSEYQWIVDPLDGTKNYINGFEIFAVSVALQKNNEIIAGAIYIPMLDKLYWAGKGKGAYLNGIRIKVSDRPVDMAIIATGFPFRYEEEIDVYLKAFREAMITFSAVRRPGAAAVDLAMTAEGVFDGFFEMKLSKWDIAAGVLLIEEAGGVFTNFHGSKELDGNVVAGGKKIHKILFDIVQRTLI